MADIKVPSLTTRPTFKTCGESDEDWQEEQNRMELAQRREVKLLQKEFRDLQAHGDASTCGAGDGQAKRKKNASMQRMLHLNLTKVELKRNLRLAADPTNLKNSEVLSSKTKRLLKTYDCHHRRVVSFIRQGHEVSDAVDKMINTLVQLRLKWTRLNQTAPDQESYTKRIDVLETRLYICTSKFNQVCSCSSKILSEISDFMFIRKAYFDKQKRILQSIKKFKEAQAKVVQKTYATYDVIENAKSRIMHLRRHATRERKMTKIILKDRRRNVDDFYKIHGFCDAKNRKRPQQKPLLTRRMKADIKKSRHYDIVLMKYKYAYSIIRNSMNFFDEHTFLNVYQHRVNNNLTLVTVNGNLSSEINSLQEQVLHLRKKNLELKQSKRNERLKHRQRKNNAKVVVYTNTKLKDQAIRERIGVEAYLTNLEDDIRSLYNLADGDKAAAQQLLGTRNLHGPASFLHSLRAIEQRCGQMLLYREDLQRQRDKFAGRPRLATFFPRVTRRELNGGPYVPRVLLTGHLEVAITEDEEDKNFLHRIYRKPELVKYIRDRMRRTHAGEESSGTSGDPSYISSAKTSSIFAAIKI